MDFRRILTALLEARVDFIVVGGVSAVLQGVPTTTFDLDIVHARTAENRRRLATVLRALDACYREHLPGKRLTPTEADLESKGHLLLMTVAGPLDVLGTVVGGLDFDDLAPRTRALELGGASVKVLDLAAVIELKERTGRDKDLAQLPLLRRTLKERESE